MFRVATQKVSSRCNSHRSRSRRSKKGSVLSVGDQSGRSLEDKVASLFQDAGCDVSVRVNVEGARGVDNVDVLVKFQSLGLGEVWVIECKDTKRPVPRGAVQLLQKKLENIGASRGILVASGGFQEGCHSTAAKSNVSLKTFEDLAESLEDDISRQRLGRLQARVVELSDRLQEMQIWGTRMPGQLFRTGLTRHLPTGPVSDQYLTRMANVGLIKEQVTEVLAGANYFLIPSPDPDPYSDEATYEVVSTLAGFCDAVEALVDDYEQWATGLEPPSG
jgi:hypothetical protein